MSSDNRHCFMEVVRESFSSSQVGNVRKRLTTTALTGRQDHYIQHKDTITPCK